MPVLLARFLVHSSVVALLIAAPPLQPEAAAAPCPPARVPPSPEYLDLVTRYASGEHAVALADLEGWSDDRLRCDLENLQAAAVAVRRCPRCEDKAVFERFSIRAAILLHADREISEQFGSPVSEQLVSCGMGPQAQVVERLAAMLMLVDPGAKVFLGRFYVAMTRRAHWSHCIRQAEQWASIGLKRLPRDATLLLTRGIVVETTAFLTLAPAPRTATLGPESLRQFDAQTTTLSALWDRARSAFEEALAADPDLHEARLRLGRVLFHLNRSKPGRARFEEVLARSDDPILLYLAHLFLGRIHEEDGHLEEAEREYKAALALRPFSEPASVALAHVRLLLGDPEGAREVLVSALEQFGRRSEIDPYKRYPMAHTSEGRTVLDQLRREALR